MKHKVHIIEDAEDDIYEIYNYVALNDSLEKAENLLNKFEEICNKLSTFPNRGHVPPELERIGIFDYKQIHYKPYRITYQLIDVDVYVHCIVDGRRDLQGLLEKRLLR